MVLVRVLPRGIAMLTEMLRGDGPPMNGGKRLRILLQKREAKVGYMILPID
jgi:hypothetical protein